ncbi:MAG: FUSC family membrane protein, partial [Pseudomonas sp.]|nr:FUSC family membrane protein [Pseudomonas sp.]
MPRPRLRQSLRRLWALDKFSASLRVFIALAGALALCWWQGWMHGLIPLFLGIIASALTETDDSWQGRLGAVLVTLACFSAAAYAVEFLFPYPWLFVIALAFSAFCLTMLGALGERFATLGSGTLILAVYSMIGVEQRG